MVRIQKNYSKLAIVLIFIVVLYSFFITPCISASSSNSVVTVELLFISGIDLIDDSGDTPYWRYYVGISEEGDDDYTWQQDCDCLPFVNDLYISGDGIHTFSGINSDSVKIAIVLYDVDDSLWQLFDDDSADISSSSNKGRDDFNTDPRSITYDDWRAHGAYIGTYDLVSNSIASGDRTDLINDPEFGQCYLINGEWDGHSGDENDALIKFDISDTYEPEKEDEDDATENDVDSNTAPVALWSSGCGYYSREVSFYDYSTDSDGYVTSWYWDFGDGTTSTEQNPTHTYSSDGTYHVTFTVTDNDGDTGTMTQEIEITIYQELNWPPTVVFGYSSNEYNRELQFSSYYYDSDGYITSWYWDFGDGTTSTEQNPTHTYSSDGTYHVTLTVTDNNGGIGSYDAYNINIKLTYQESNESPYADFGALYNSWNWKVIFSDISRDSDGYITSWYWDFGDGTTSTEQNPTHTYSSDGTKTISLTVWDDDDASDTRTYSINLITYLEDNSHPKAGFGYASSSVFDKKEIYFSDLSSDTDGSILSWSWDFGDGFKSTEQSPNHVYSSDGTYYVTLKVTDNAGSTDIFSENIEVPFEKIEEKAVKSTEIDGYQYYLTSTNNDSIPEFMTMKSDYDGEVTYVAVPVTYTSGEVKNINEEDDETIVTVGVEKANWIYMEITDQYPSISDLTVQTSDGRVISSDMIWRENGKIYVLDDPDVVYDFIYSNSNNAAISNSQSASTIITFDYLPLIPIIVIAVITLLWVGSFARYRKNKTKAKKIRKPKEHVHKVDNFVKEKTLPIISEKQYQLLKMVYFDITDPDVILAKLGCSFDQLEPLVNGLIQQGYMKLTSDDEAEITRKGNQYIKSKM